MMQSFQEIIQGDQPVLVDFYASWCAPCRTMSPVIESIGKEMQGIARVLKIDIDRNQQVATQFGVQAVPSFFIFQQGQIVWKHAGVVDKETLKNKLLHFSK